MICQLFLGKVHGVHSRGFTILNYYFGFSKTVWHQQLGNQVYRLVYIKAGEEIMSPCISQVYSESARLGDFLFRADNADTTVHSKEYISFVWTLNQKPFVCNARTMPLNQRAYFQTIIESKTEAALL